MSLWLIVLLTKSFFLAFFSWKDAWTSPESLNLSLELWGATYHNGLANPVVSLQLYWSLVFFCSWQFLLSSPNWVWRTGWWVLSCVPHCDCLLVSNTFCRKIDLVQRASHSTACNSDQWGEGHQGQHCTAHPGLDSEHSWTPNWDGKTACKTAGCQFDDRRYLLGWQGIAGGDRGLRWERSDSELDISSEWKEHVELDLFSHPTRWNEDLFRPNQGWQWKVKHGLFFHQLYFVSVKFEQSVFFTTS